MIFGLISPLRVHSEKWSDYSTYVSRTFRRRKDTNTIADDWSFFDGDALSFRAVGQAANFEDALDFCGEVKQALRRIRRNSFALKELEDNGLLVVFETGDCAVVQKFEVDGCAETVIGSVDSERSRTLDMVKRAAAEMVPFLGRHDPAEVFDRGATITHTVLLCATENATQVDVVDRAYKSEYLKFDPNQKAGSFCPGWSFSTVIGSNADDWIDHFCLMVRLQCAWYTTRTNRDYCLRKLADIDLKQPVEKLIETERELVKRQTKLRIWQHQLSEYRANLLPSLTKAADAVEVLWEVGHAQDYVHETLEQGRAFIQTSYSSRLLVQERRQSTLLFALTTISVLGLAATADSIWGWLTRANLVDPAAVSQGHGQASVIVGLGLLFFGFMIIWIGYLAIRNRQK